MGKVGFMAMIAGFCLISVPGAFGAGGNLIQSLPAGEEMPYPPNFHVVVPGQVYRGARPSEKQLETLRAMGVRTVLDLEGDSVLLGKQIEAEQGRIQQAGGMDFVSIPISVCHAPSDAQVEKILSVLADPKRQPIFIHCHEGRDRTGLFVALFNVLKRDASPVSACATWLKYGYKYRRLWFYEDYFAKRTGLHCTPRDELRACGTGEPSDPSPIVEFVSKLRFDLGIED